MFQAALRPQALKCSVARTLQASEEARVTAAAKLFQGIKRLSERVLVHEGLSIFADAVKAVADRHGVISNGEPKPHTTGRPAGLRGLTGGSSFDGA